MGRLVDAKGKAAKNSAAKKSDDIETYVWRDASGASVRIELQGGRCTRWELQRDPLA